MNEHEFEFTNVRPPPPPEPPAVLPDRMKQLPVSRSLGLPIPWYADIVDGEPELIHALARVGSAIDKQTCWICGQKLGQFIAFTMYPLITIEWAWNVRYPPAHKECAIYCARVPLSPLLPPVALVWICKGYKVRHSVAEFVGTSITITPDPLIEGYWYTQGRTATRIEIEAEIAARVLSLQEFASNIGPAALAGLSGAVDLAQALLPPV